jgi:multidrug transporter EmrE-like cation transporter
VADSSKLPSSIPSGVVAIAIAFFIAAAYLGSLGVVMLASPGAVSMALGAPLLNGLELAGPYMFLLIAGVGALIGSGLLRLNNWARRAAIVVAFIGVAMLVPSASAAAVDFRASLLWSGLGIIVRVIIVWYLYQEPVAETFKNI